MMTLEISPYLGHRWGWGCVAAGIQVPEGWKCPGCGCKPTKDQPTMMKRPDGQVVCAGCARRLHDEEATDGRS